ncbi:hypothetical protein BpHYR1_000527 [Brachionus plicatilis]|uniref:Uncharacterized protein n=1 Tax=Brachionus plicatilis TaxID=10195 RepID=A0A3M7R476_BRAPC|nr:hypothetical protein BpHYR1_000527 [Brachionus plicatilis]
MPVTVTRLPGTILSHKYRSVYNCICRGISPFGTFSANVGCRDHNSAYFKKFGHLISGELPNEHWISFRTQHYLNIFDLFLSIWTWPSDFINNFFGRVLEQRQHFSGLFFEQFAKFFVIRVQVFEIDLEPVASRVVVIPERVSVNVVEIAVYFGRVVSAIYFIRGKSVHEEQAHSFFLLKCFTWISKITTWLKINSQEFGSNYFIAYCIILCCTILTYKKIFLCNNRGAKNQKSGCIELFLEFHLVGFILSEGYFSNLLFLCQHTLKNKEKFPWFVKQLENIY